MRVSSLRALGHVSRLALAAAACAAPVGLLTPAAAHAQAAESQQDFAIPAGPLAKALQTYSTATGVQLVYASELVEGAQSPGVSGRMTRAEALSKLLAGTGLTASLQGNSATIRHVGTAADGARVLGPVRVEGAQGDGYFGTAGQAAGLNGVNGSRDITATEGTGSFTSGALTIGSKVPQALKDVPQSISVLTNERIEQQNIIDFTDAMRELPGISLSQGTTNLETNFSSRGFAITSIQIDGGAPITTASISSNVNQGFFPQLDMSIYDHVELLRGADGTFNGYGSPSGSVNLVRKKPLDHPQYTLEAQAGSWDTYRVVADATSPLALDGKLRGRLVMTYQDNHYFYATAKDNKNLIYGILELDATPSTLLTAGINYTKQNSVPWAYGLPRYIDGGDLKLPRSTSLAMPWSRWDFDTTEIFGSIEQKIGNDWTFKFNASDTRQNSYQKLGYSNGAVNDRADAVIPNAGPVLNGYFHNYTSDQLSTEATLTGAFKIFDQRQEVTIGASRVDSDFGGQLDYGNLINNSSAASPYQPYPGGPTYYYGSPNGPYPPINVFHFNPNDPRYSDPGDPMATGLYSPNYQIEELIYANVRLTAFNRLHLITGLRWSRYAIANGGEDICNIIPTTGTDRCVGHQVGDIVSANNTTSASGTAFSWPPSVTATFDITRNLNAYVGYTDIYIDQSHYLNDDLKPIDPLTGSNWEAGLKWAAHGGRLNFSVAAFHIEQKGGAALAGNYDFNTTAADNANGIYYYFVGLNGRRVANGTAAPGILCCFISDPNNISSSKGIDLEATGEVLPGWQIAASYTYNTNEYKGSSVGTSAGLPFNTIAPKNLYKLWTSYDFAAGGRQGWLSGLTLSGGVNGQSSGYQSGTACTRPGPADNLGNSGCDPTAVPVTVDYNFRVPAYAVFSARVDYRFSKHWSLALNLENILDKTYYQTAGNTSGGNWYGAPRSFTFSMRAKW